MQVSIIQISCRGAYKPDHLGEEIDFECLIQEINTGVNISCSYSPGHNEWGASFPGKPKLGAIAEPTKLDWESYMTSIHLCDEYMRNENLYRWWAAYPIEACRARLEEIVTTPTPTEYSMV